MCSHLAYHPEPGTRCAETHEHGISEALTRSNAAINSRCYEMSTSAVLLIHPPLLHGVLGRFGLLARPAPRGQFLAHEHPGADQKPGTDDRRRWERGEILEHVGLPRPLCFNRVCFNRGPPCPRGHWRRPDETGAGPAMGTLPGALRSPLRGGRHSRTSMRVFPRVFGFTRSRSRNSATPSS